VAVQHSPLRDDDGAGSTLSPDQESILAFEQLQWRRASAKDDAIRARFGISPATYYVRLSRLLESPDAMAYDPLLVQRLQRRVEQHERWRTGAAT